MTDQRRHRRCYRNPAHPTPVYKNNPSTPWSPGPFIVLIMLLAAPLTAILRQAQPVLAQSLLGWLATASVITYLLYAWDKRRAVRGEWRTPETVLHFWELIGGWPGAFLAQRRLRHKSSKTSYQFTFWLIVIAHQYLAVDWLLDGSLFNYITGRP